MIPYVDYGLCVGCGACAEVYPKLFEMRGDVAWVIIHDGLKDEDLERVVNVCPFGAISVQ